MGDTLHGDISRPEPGAWVSPIPEWDHKGVPFTLAGSGTLKERKTRLRAVGKRKIVISVILALTFGRVCDNN